MKRESGGQVTALRTFQSGYGVVMARDPRGGVVVAGDFDGQVAFTNGKPLEAKGLDIFVVEFDASLNVQRATSYGGDGDESITAVSLDSSGNMALAGVTSSDWLNLGCGHEVVPGGMSRAFVASYDSARACQWTRFAHAGTWGAFDARALGVDSAGGVVVGGNVAHDTDFGDGLNVTVPNDVRQIGYVLSLDKNGRPRWLKEYGSTKTMVVSSLAVDPWSNVVVGGRFGGVADFGNRTYGSANMDGFVLKLAPSGTRLWDVRFGDADGDAIMGVTVDESGNVAAVGTVVGATSIGTTPIGKGRSKQALVMKLSP
jgi:hypothetical protein